MNQTTNPGVEGPHRWRSYLATMLAAALAVVCLVGGFNMLVDPMGVFNAPKWPGVNAVKPYLMHHRELVRFYKARRWCGDLAILGNSRAEIGFDPSSPAFAAAGLKPFNHAIAGTGLSTSHRQLLWLEAEKCTPQTIFLGVDFFDFLGGATPRPLQNLQTHPIPALDTGFWTEAVFSLTGLRDSVATLVLQRDRFAATTTDRGFNPLLEYVPEAQRSGYFPLFRQRASENLTHWARRPARLRPVAGGPSEDEAVLGAILAQGQSTDSKMVLIIYPYHAQVRLMVERLGLGALFADWKRQVFEAAQQQSGKGAKIELWDFSGLSPETLEEIPAKGDRATQLRFYWEGGHFKKELGDRLISRVLGGPGEFGVRLSTPEQLENWLSLDRQQVQQRLAVPSRLLTDVDEVFAARGKK